MHWIYGLFLSFVILFALVKSAMSVEENMGVESENPKLFLEKAKEELENYQGIQESLKEAFMKEKEAKASYEKESTAVKDKIEKTIRERQKELEKSYDEKISQSDGKIKKVQNEREAAKNKGMKERITEESAPTKRENKELKREMAALCKREGAPEFIAHKVFSVLYRPVGFSEFLILLLLFLLVFAILPLSLYYFLLQDRGILFLVGIYLLDILLFGGVYVFVGNRTVGKYREAVKQCVSIRKRILKNKKALKVLAKDIRKDTDEGQYNLSSFDDEIARLTEERNAYLSQKQNALHNFDTVGKEVIRDEIEKVEKEKLDTLQSSWQNSTEERMNLEAKEREASLLLTKDVEQYVGKKHMSVEDMDGLLHILEEGKAGSLTEAILCLEEGK